MVIGAITPNDCSDVRDTTSVSAINGLQLYLRWQPEHLTENPVPERVSLFLTSPEIT